MNGIKVKDAAELNKVLKQYKFTKVIEVGKGYLVIPLELKNGNNAGAKAGKK
jgi:hypothetical protein